MTLHKEQLNLNLLQIRMDALSVNQHVNEVFKEAEQTYKVDDKTPISTRVANSYNIFTYPCEQIYELYKQIQRIVRTNMGITTPQYIQGWVNIYEQGQNLGWHQHWSGKMKSSLHGFYCAQTDGSVTEYRFNNGTTEIVPSIDNLIVIGNSNNNTHKTSEWENEYPRITIAFDVHPLENVEGWANHWIPL